MGSARLATRLFAVACVVAAWLAQPTPALATPLTFTVNATDDNRGLCGGFAVHCTLRAAIVAANDNPGTDTIDFSVAGLFIPGSALDTITDPVTIDGYTAPGASPNTSTTSDTAVLTAVLSCDGQAFAGLTVGTTGAGTTIRGLVIQNCFDHPGIQLDGNANLVAGNFIGTTANGNDNQANQVGIQASSKDNVIGGTAPADRNLISGNTQDGVDLFNTGNTVEGNFIGTDATGTQGIPNAAFGVKVGAEANTIGGVGSGAGNLISGNGIDSGGGVIVDDEGNGGTTIQGNLIGTSADGTADVGNHGPGVQVSSVFDTVGGSAAGAGNTIAFNHGDGISIDHAGTQVIGNVIHDNLNAGVAVYSPGSGLFSRNLVFSHPNDVGIDLAGDGPTPNDAGDGDTGPNGLQNFPDLTDAHGGPFGTTVTGTLDSAPSMPFTLEFFSGPSCDSFGRGQASTFLGSSTATTDASGTASFTASFPTPPGPGDTIVTATTTDVNGDTSELSPCTDIIQSVTIAFTSDRSGNREIYLMNGDGTAVRRLTRNAAADFEPALATNAVVFVSTRHGNRELYAMDLSGGNVTRLTRSPGGDFEPAVGPGEEIAFTSTRDGNREIYLMTFSELGPDVTRLTNDPAADYDPTIDANGEILFTSTRSGHREVYRWNASGPPTRLTSNVHGDFEPSGGQGGEYVFTSLRDGNREVYRWVPPDGTAGHFDRLTTNPYGDFQPAVNSDSLSEAFGDVLFVSTRNGNQEIYRESNGSLTRLTHNAAGDLEPSWMAPAPGA